MLVYDCALGALPEFFHHCYRCTHAYAHAHRYTCANTHTHAHSHIHSLPSSYTHSYTHTHTLTHIRTHTHTHIHTTHTLTHTRWAELKTAAPDLPALIAATTCVANDAGQMVEPRTLVNPNAAPVLAAVFAGFPDRVPSRERYAAQAWSAFLSDVGVRGTMDAALFREACEDVLQRRPRVATAHALLRCVNPLTSKLVVNFCLIVSSIASLKNTYGLRTPADTCCNASVSVRAFVQSAAFF